MAKYIQNLVKNTPQQIAGKNLLNFNSFYKQQGYEPDDIGYLTLESSAVSCTFKNHELIIKNTATGSGVVVWWFKVPINLTPFSKLYVDYSYPAGSNNLGTYCRSIGVLSQRSFGSLVTYDTSGIIYKKFSQGSNLQSFLDVSSLTDCYYVLIFGTGDVGTNTITSVKLL